MISPGTSANKRGWTVIAKDPQGDIAALLLRLAELDLERERVLAELDRLKQSDALKPVEPKASAVHVPGSSIMSNADKVALLPRFRSLAAFGHRPWCPLRRPRWPVSKTRHNSRHFRARRL
jgi:hypothetical protein